MPGCNPAFRRSNYSLGAIEFMQTEKTLILAMGCLFLLVGVLLSMVKVDKEGLVKSACSNPGLALFMFPAFRWGVVTVLLVFGAVLVSIGLGKVA